MSEAAHLRAFVAKASREQVSTVTRALSLRTLTGVVLKTPVDTGRARGGWQTSVGVPPPGGPSTREDKSGSAVISEGAAEIGKQTGFQQVVLQNNVPYIDKLDEGYSKQAPDGMVALTLSSLGLDPGRD